MIVSAFSEYCAEPYTVEAVTIKSARGTTVTPVRGCSSAPSHAHTHTLSLTHTHAPCSLLQSLAYRTEHVAVENIYRRMGIPRTVAPAEVARLLTRMQLSAKLGM